MTITADIPNFTSLPSMQEVIRVINLQLECLGDGDVVEACSDDREPLSMRLFPTQCHRVLD